MAATRHLSALQFEHGVNAKGIHRLDAVDEHGTSLGYMTWHSRPDIDEGFIKYLPGEIGMINVEVSRQGVATALWHEGQKYDPAPVHSPYRTPQGDSWARKIGGRLPRADKETGQRTYE
jgi:hypothetical protein